MSFFSQNHTEINSDDWTITKKTTRTIKHENFSKMKNLKVDRWALSLRWLAVNFCCCWNLGILYWFFCEIHAWVCIAADYIIVYCNRWCVQIYVPVPQVGKLVNYSYRQFTEQKQMGSALKFSFWALSIPRQFFCGGGGDLPRSHTHAHTRTRTRTYAHTHKIYCLTRPILR